MESLGLDNLFNSSGDSIFDGSPAQEEKPVVQEPVAKEQPPVVQEDTKPAEVKKVDGDSLFSQPESVSSEENTVNKSEEGSGGAQQVPPKSVFASIANALKEEGVLPDLESDKIKDIKGAEDFSALIESQVNAKLTDTQKKVNEALNAGVAPDDIRLYQNTIDTLDSIKEDSIKAEDANGTKIRQNLIYQDLITRGFSEERAAREVQRSVSSGEDVQDALEAKNSLSNYYRTQYSGLLEEARQRETAAQAAIQKQEDELKKSMIDDAEIFAGVNIDPGLRKKAFDSVTKPIYKDEQGNYYTAVQKYQRENPVDFRKKLGVLYTLTDGFKNMDKIVTGSAKRAVHSKLKEIEHALNNMPTNPDGSYSFVGDSSDATKDSGWKIDV